MKKFLVAVVGVVVLLAAAVVVLPNLIDWNAYRDRIAAQVEALTGRDLTIEGDVSITLLPAPALVVHEVSLANLDGASTRTMATLERLEVRIALAPLLGGDVEVETVRMVNPVIDLERLADGRVNWEFHPRRSGEGGRVSAPLAGLSGRDGTAGNVRVDDFQIENGTIVFRDAMQGLVERLEQVNARLAAVSLDGPIDSAGKLHYRGVPLSYELSLGRVIEGRTVPLNMILAAESHQARAELSGAIVDLAEVPRFRGKTVMAVPGLAGLIDDMFGTGAAPAVLGGPFRIEGDVQLSKDGLEIQKVAATLGDIRASGQVAVAFGEIVNVDARLTAGRIDLDALMAAKPAGPEASAGGSRTSQDVAIPTQGAQAFALPDGVNGTIELLADAITFNGGVVSEARVVASLSGGEITFSQISALLPGGSDVFATGFLTAENDAPKFDGNVDAKVSDLRRVMSWLGAEVPEIPSDRLRQASLKGRIIVDTKTLQGVNLDAAIDSSRITGSLTLALRKRLAFGANLKVDRINLDAYFLPEPQKPASPSAATAGAAGAATADPVAVLGFLNRFDSNLKLEIGNLAYHRVGIGDIALDATLFGGSLQVRAASVGDLAGASGSMSGSLTGLTQIPAFENLQFEFSEIDVPRLLRLFEIDAPSWGRDMGATALRGRINGSILRPQTDLVVETREGAVDAAGRFSIVPVEPLFAGDLKLRHNDLPQLLRLFGVEYRPTGRLGEVALSTALKATTDTVSLEGIDARIGAAEAKGKMTIDLSGARPRIVADLEAGDIDIDPFLPADGRASHGLGFLPQKAEVGGAPLIHVAWRPAGNGARPGDPAIRLAAAPAARWSRDPIDLAVLQTFDGEIKLKAASLELDDVRLVQAVSEATVTEGVLRIAGLTGKLFGGDFKGVGTVRSAPDTAVTGTASLTGADFGELEKALRGESAAAGSLGFRFAFEGVGPSMADLVSSLGGEGSFEVRKVSLRDNSGKPQRGAIAGLLSGLNQVAMALTGGSQRQEGLADVSGTFTVEKGIAESGDLRFASSAGEGTARGALDLPAWTMDVSGDIQLSQNLISQILSGTTGVQVSMPFRIKGSIDEPSVIIDTARLPGKVLRIPGQILDKTGDVLRRLIPAP